MSMRFFIALFGLSLVWPVTSMASSSDLSLRPQNVVIAGAGVCGLSTAYFLAKEFSISSTLIDPTGRVAPAASGKAGGFLALDWCDYSATGPLARRSFALHQEIADAVGAETIQYRRLTCSAISVAGQAIKKPQGKKLDCVEWAEAPGIVGARPLGDEETIAQVHPRLLCETLFKETKRLAPPSKILSGKVVGAAYDENDKTKILGARLEDGSLIEGDALLFACGPWSTKIGIKYHSVVVPTARVFSQCVFFSGCGDPEVRNDFKYFFCAATGLNLQAL